MPVKEAVLLLAHGSPEKPEDVPVFIRNITGGRPISPETMQEVEHRHGLIGSHPLLTLAFAEKLAPAWKQISERTKSKVPVIFTAHSVPRRTIEEGDPYETQAKETAALVAARVPEVKEWKFAFQSQGMSGGPGSWIGPTVEETILQLKSAGHRAVLVQPIGFVCDHVEVLYDIDIGFKQFAREQGMELERTESLNASPTFA